MNPVDVVVLAAGVGSRLQPYTNNIPKCMIDVAGMPLLHRLLQQIEALRGKGTLRAHVVIGYQSWVIRHYFSSTSLRINFIENPRYTHTNNMYSLSLATQHLTPEADLVIVNGDCIYDPEILQTVVTRNFSCIAVDSSVYFAESMKVRVHDGYVRGISKDYQPGDSVITSIDLYKFARREKSRLLGEVARLVNSGIVDQWTEIAIDRISRESDVRIVPVDISGRRWAEIDNLYDLEAARQLFA